MTLVCMVPGCHHMAQAGKVWDDNLCAEHDGGVPNLRSWTKELTDIEQFSEVTGRAGTDFLSLPDAISLGRIGRLLPLPISDFNALEHFSIRKIHSGGKHGVVFVNGFLSERHSDVSDWTRCSAERFGEATQYHLDWEASRHPKDTAMDSAFTSIGSKVPVVHAALTAVNALAAWHMSMKNAGIAGRLLANAIVRTPGWQFTLAGHSLGARVIHFALVELAKQHGKRIDNVYLLGAAVGGGDKDAECWRKAADAVGGKIFNCFSQNDHVLARDYRTANAMMSEPAGYSGIKLKHDQVHNMNCSALVDGHSSWKSRFDDIIFELELQP